MSPISNDTLCPVCLKLPAWQWGFAQPDEFCDFHLRNRFPANEPTLKEWRDAEEAAAKDRDEWHGWIFYQSVKEFMADRLWRCTTCGFEAWGNYLELHVHEVYGCPARYLSTDEQYEQLLPSPWDHDDYAEPLRQGMGRRS